MSENIHAKNCCLSHGCHFGNNEKCDVYRGNVSQLNRCGELALCAGSTFYDLQDYDDNVYQD